MTPEERAEYLIKKFQVYAHGVREVNMRCATACAIIHCQLFIGFLANYPTPRDITIQMELDHYKQVLSILKNK